MMRLTRTPTLEAPDGLEHWSLNVFQSLRGIIEDAATADRKALSDQASKPLKRLEDRNPGLTRTQFMQTAHSLPSLRIQVPFAVARNRVCAGISICQPMESLARQGLSHLESLSSGINLNTEVGGSAFAASLGGKSRLKIWGRIDWIQPLRSPTACAAKPGKACGTSNFGMRDKLPV